MHTPYSEVHAFKKPLQSNASVRVTINPQPEPDANINQTNKQAITKQKSFSIMSNKNYQYFSTSVLPSYFPLQHINNCEISNSIQNNNIQPLLSHDMKSSQSLSKRVKKGQVSQHKLKMKKESMPNQNTKYGQTLLHHKSNSKLNAQIMRQTTSPNCVSLLPKHKQPEWMQKIESYSKNSNNVKINNSHRPYDIHKQPYLKIQQQQKSSAHNQNNHLHTYPHQSSQEETQNGHNTSGNNNKKTFFRQTLDPQFQRNLLDSTDLKNHRGGAYQFFKKVERQFKDLSGNKMGKNFRTETKYENKSTHLKTNFWRHKMLLSPQNLKPQSPHKPQFGLSKDLSIPLLPLHTSQKQSCNKPSFFFQKKCLSRFSIMKQIGTGTYNDAFLCMDKKTNAIFCMKKYHKSTIKSFPNVLQYFIKKISFQLLIDDPNVVQLYHVFSEGDHVYTIQEFMEGGRLIDCFQRQLDAREAKRRQTQNLVSDVKDSNQQLLLSQSRIIDRIYDIASALKQIHHCQDLTSKPENTRRSKLPPMVHGDIRTKSILMSMGVCKIPSIEPANTKLLYVNQYSPPQLIIEKIFIPKSDIWNLGLVLYELCAEKKLFSNKDLGQETERQIGGKSGYQIFNVNIHEQIDKLSGTTALVKDLMKKMLSIQPQNRPNAGEILSSNVFRMYGLDVQWKQRRNQKIMKQKDMKELQKIEINKTGQAQQHEQQMRQMETPGKKQLTLPNNTNNTNKSNSPCTNLSFSRESNSNYTYDETQIEVLSLVKPHWTQKTKNQANKDKGKDERNRRQLN